MKTPGLFRKEVVADLCERCAALYDARYTLNKIAGGADPKACFVCGKHGYVGTYEIARKKKREF